MQFFITNFIIEPYSLVDYTLWKGGVLWMVDNVEILVEVVQEESSVVLMGRSDVCNQLKCMDIFVKVVDIMLEAKSVCCGGIVHKVDALDPNALESKTIPSGDEMLWCDASSAVRALTRSRKNIQSNCKTKQFSVEKALLVYTLIKVYTLDVRFIPISSNPISSNLILSNKMCTCAIFRLKSLKVLFMDKYNIKSKF